MKLTFLGTGTSQGVPVITCKCNVCTSSDPRDKRLRSSALLTTNTGANILFDIGPDFRQQMLTHNIRHLDAILITHAHRDHVAGIDDIRAYNYTQNEPLNLYANNEAAETLRRDYHYIFSPHKYPGLPEANLHIINNLHPFIAAGETIIPIAAMHKDLPILAYRIGDFAYITDANHISQKEMAKLIGLKILVINALRIERHWSHYCLNEALQIIHQISPERAYLTHISHEMGLHSEISNILDSSTFLAQDNLSIEL